MQVIAAIATVIAAIASLISIVLAIRAISDSNAVRKEAARDRDRRRLEKIGDQLEVMFATAVADREHLPHQDDWRSSCGRLMRYLAATKLDLPATHAILEATSPQHAINAITDARPEILRSLTDIADDDALAAEPANWWQPALALIASRRKVQQQTATTEPAADGLAGRAPLRPQ